MYHLPYLFHRLLDANGGERLEKWGDFTLIRPDPQVIWNGERNLSGWKKADGIYRRSRSGGGEWIKKDVPEEWIVSYGELKFGISPMGFKHTGLFPEQAANWDWFSKLIKNSGREIKLLNLFAYTGGASVAAAKAGAFVCHVDASKGIVAKAKRNAELSGIPQNKIRYIVDDCFKFVAREIRRGNKYDAVILDPPSFGRGPGGEKWVIEECLDEIMTGRFGMVLRAKGIVASEDGRWIHFDYVPGEKNLRYGTPDFTGKLCVIGTGLDKHALKHLFERG